MPITFENTTTILASPKKVFAYLADLENIPRWNYAIQQTTKTSPGPIGVDTAYRQTRTIPRPMEEELVITAYEPDRLLTIEGGLGPFQASLTYQLKPAADGTELTNTVQLNAEGPLGLAAPLLSGQIKHAVAENIQVLKGLLGS